MSSPLGASPLLSRGHGGLSSGYAGHGGQSPVFPSGRIFPSSLRARRGAVWVRRGTWPDGQTLVYPSRQICLGTAGHSGLTRERVALRANYVPRPRGVCAHCPGAFPRQGSRRAGRVWSHRRPLLGWEVQTPPIRQGTIPAAVIEVGSSDSLNPPRLFGAKLIWSPGTPGASRSG